MRSKGHDYLRVSESLDSLGSDYDSDAEKKKEAIVKLKYVNTHLLMKGVNRELNMT